MKKRLGKHALHLIIGGFMFVVYISGFVGGCLVQSMKTETVVYAVCTPTNATTGTVTESGTTTTTLCTTTTQSSVIGSEVDIPLSSDLQWYIRVKAAEYGVPLALVYAVIETESGFDAQAVSDTGDYGLMQINEEYHAYYCVTLGIDDCINPYNNVLAGIYILSGYIDDYGKDLDAVLMCYNGGAGYLALMWNKGVYSTDYTDKVIARFEAYGGYDYV